MTPEPSYQGRPASEESTGAGELPLLFIAPHQDDELLSMGAAIKAAVAHGREVAVLIVGRGNKSVVRTRDLPVLLGYIPSEWEFARVRDREFRWCVENLGARAILPSYVERLDERTFTADAVTDFIRTFGSREVEVHTLTALGDLNPDHVACAQAAAALHAEGWLTRPPRFYTHVSRRRAVEELGYAVAPEGRHTPVTRADQEPYRFTDLATERWGVGYRSVPYMFEAQLTDPAAYRVLGPSPHAALNAGWRSSTPSS